MFDGETLVDLQPDEQNRAKELIEDFMIAANGVTRAIPRAQGLCRRCAACCRRPERWDRIVELAAQLRRTRCRATPDAPRSMRSSTTRREADPQRFPDLSLAVVKLLGRGEYVARAAGPTRRRALRARRARLRAFDRAEPPLPRSRHPAAAQGGARRRAARPTPTTSSTRSRATAREQEDNAAKVERQVRKSAAALLLASRIGERFDAIVTGASDEGHVGAHRASDGRRQASCAASRGSTSATACASSSSRTDVAARLHRLRRVRREDPT